MMLEITISSPAPHFSQEHQLFGRSYIFEFEWLESECYWCMHVYDGVERPLALGLRILIGEPIFVEVKTSMVLFLVAKVPNAELNLQTLSKDFFVVAHELI